MEDLKLLGSAPSPGQRIIWEWIDQGGPVQFLTQEKFRELTGVSFINGYRAHPANLMEYDATKRTGLLPSDPISQKFDPGMVPRTLLKRNAQGQFGVIAGERISQHTILFYFGGEIFDIEQSKTTYKGFMCGVPNIDPSVVSGKGSFINDGAPNCALFSLNDFRGLPMAPVVISLRDIREGEELFVDYGSCHPVKGGRFRVDEEHLQECLQHFTLDAFNNILRVQLEVETQHYRHFITPLYVRRQFLYVFNTPYVFLKIHFREPAKIDTTLGILRDRLFQCIIESEPPYQKAYFYILEWIKNHPNPRQLEPFLDRFRLETCMQLLVLASSDPNPSLEAYEIFGDLVDKLYVYVNGTDFGTYLGREDEKRVLEQRLDSAYFHSMLEKLPSKLRTEFKDEVSRHLKDVGHLEEKVDILKMLKNTCI